MRSRAPMSSARSAIVERFVVPRCIGCGAMREFETCGDGCNERRVEIVPAGKLDDLADAELSSRARIEAVLPLVMQVADQEPTAAECPDLYRSLSGAARQALRDAGSPLSASADEVPTPPISVWRCDDCGGVDAPQECIGVCVWRRFEWVEASALEDQRTRTAHVQQLERSIFGLLGLLAFVTPRPGAWERNWAALHAEARDVIDRWGQSGAVEQRVA